MSEATGQVPLSKLQKLVRGLFVIPEAHVSRCGCKSEHRRAWMVPAEGNVDGMFVAECSCCGATWNWRGP